jgi:phosphatidylglycerophosphate synthase
MNGGVERRPGGNAGIVRELAAGGLGVLVLGVAAVVLMAAPLASVGAAILVYGLIAALVAYCWAGPERVLGPANRVTLGRAVLVAWLAGAVSSPDWVAQQATLIVAVAGLALALDGVDGWVARRCRCESAFGARFDMELDAFLILVLCVHLMLLGKAGPWVLAIGAMRYVFVAAMCVLPWLDAPLPPSLRRKWVCVWQVASLMVCLLPVISGAVASVVLLLALVLLALSFAVDVRGLYRQRPG